MHTQIDTCIDTHIDKQTGRHIDTYTQRYIHTQTHACRQVNSQTYRYMHTYIGRYVHTRRHINTQTQTHIDTCMHRQPGSQAGRQERRPVMEPAQVTSEATGKPQTRERWRCGSTGVGKPPLLSPPIPR